MSDPSPQSCRIDRWLWYARQFKTRSLAGRVVAAAGVRIEREGQTFRTEKPSFGVRVGDTLALVKGERPVILEVLNLGTRRGPAPEAQALYVDHSPPPVSRAPKPDLPFAREAGAGRPTKKERRALDGLREIGGEDG